MVVLKSVFGRVGGNKQLTSDNIVPSHISIMQKHKNQVDLVQRLGRTFNIVGGTISRSGNSQWDHVSPAIH